MECRKKEKFLKNIDINTAKKFLENIDIGKEILENIYIDIAKKILKNIDINITKIFWKCRYRYGNFENIDIDKGRIFAKYQ